jgi:hypothetical protein
LILRLYVACANIASIPSLTPL